MNYVICKALQKFNSDNITDYLVFNSRHEWLKHWVSGCFFLHLMTLSSYKGLEMSCQVSPKQCFTCWYGQQCCQALCCKAWFKNL